MPRSVCNVVLPFSTSGLTFQQRYDTVTMETEIPFPYQISDRSPGKETEQLDRSPKTSDK